MHLTAEEFPWIFQDILKRILRQVFALKIYSEPLIQNMVSYKKAFLPYLSWIFHFQLRGLKLWEFTSQNWFLAIPPMISFFLENRPEYSTRLKALAPKRE